MVNKRRSLTCLFLLGMSTTVWATAPAGAVPQSPCLMFADFLERDWFFPDP